VIALALAVVFGIALRIRLALVDLGIYWPDEVHQSLEPAHRLVFGYGLVALDYTIGSRNWTFPALIASLLEAARAVGLDSPRDYVPLVRVACALVSAATAVGAFVLARRLHVGTLAAAAGASLVMFSAAAIYFAPRALSENVSALPVVLGLALALPRGASTRASVLGSALLALAVLIRLQNALFCVVLLAVVAPGERRRAAVVLGVLGMGAVLFGVIDLVTWGAWFHSAFAYVDLNVVKGTAALYGTAPPSYYPRVLFTSMPVIALLALPLATLGVRRAPALAIVVGSFLVLHTLQPHKELRFLLPALPLVAALAAVGLDDLMRHPRSVRAAAVMPLFVIVASMLSALRADRLTFGDIGQYEATKRAASAYDDWGSVNRLLIAAGERDDVCGLKVESVDLAWTGGYTYLHRAVPLYGYGGPDRHTRFFDHVITPRSESLGLTAVSSDGEHVLARLGHDSCRPDNDYDWRLEPKSERSTETR
jgi:GPI mannosyltransferase 3